MFCSIIFKESLFQLKEVFKAPKFIKESTVRHFRKNVTYHNIKTPEKAEIYPLSRKYIFGKTTG